MGLFDSQAPLEAVPPPVDYGAGSAKRQRMLADMLRKKAEAAGPQGQMVSGHYVAPSWTQHLATIAGGAGAGYMEGKAQEAEDASTKQITEARQKALSNLPQATAAQYGPQQISGLGGREQISEPSIIAQAQPLKREDVYKKYAELAQIPGTEKIADAYLKSGTAEIEREDKQVESQRAQAAMLEERRAEAERRSNDQARTDWQRSQDKAEELAYRRDRDKMEDRRARELAALKAGEKPVTESSAQAKERQTTEQNVNSAMSRENALKGAKELVEKSTGSLYGRGRDYVAGLAGASTEGSRAIADLKALEGRLLANTPKFSGPTSDRDVIVYQQAVGKLADPSTPVGDRLSALRQVREMSRDDYHTSVRMAGNFNKRAVSPDHTVDVPEFKLEPLEAETGPRTSGGKVSVLPQAVAAQAPPAQKAAVGKPAPEGANQVIGGVKYVKRNGQWFQE